MGKSTISMAIFNSYVKLPEGRVDWRVVKKALDEHGWTAMLNIFLQFP